MARIIRGVGLTLWLVSLTLPVQAERPDLLVTPVVKTATATTAQTATTLWTPASGTRIVLMGCVFSADRAYLVRLQVSGTDIVAPVYLDTNGTVSVGFGVTPLYVGATNAVITYTTTNAGFTGASGNAAITCTGYETL